jgi:tetratricopeptide (TPR) repeat protein
VAKSILRVLVAPSQPLVFKGRPLPSFNLAEERRRISIAVRNANVAARLHFLPLVTTETLASTCQDPWDIVHLSGHSEGNCLLVEDGLGGALPVAGSRLTDILRSACPSVIFVSSCHSEIICRSLADNCDAAIVAIDAIAPIADRAAILFGECFYFKVLGGCSAREAFEYARRMVAADPIVGDSKCPIDLTGYPQAPWSARFKLLGRTSVALAATAGICEEIGVAHLPAETLPQCSPWFVGRQMELAQAIEALSRERKIAMIVGPPGIGKSELAAAAIHWFVERDSCDMVFWASARPNDSRQTFYDLRSLLDLMAVAFAAHSTGTLNMSVMKELIVGSIGTKRILFFIDELDYLNRDSASDVLEFLKAAPIRTRVLIGSREDIPTAGIETVLLGELDARSAVELFALRANRSGSPQDSTIIPAICDRLGGHPLALTVVAAQADGDLTLEQIIAHLIRSERHSGAEVSGGAIISRVWASLDLSYDRLSDEQKRTFAFLGAFFRPVLPEYIEGLIGVTDGADVLKTLAQKSLCHGRGDGYMLLPVVSDYARRKYETTEGDIGGLHVSLGLFFKVRCLKRLKMDDTEESYYRRDGVIDAELAASDHLFEAAFRYEIKEAGPAFRSEVEDFYPYLVRFGLWSDARKKAKEMVDLARSDGNRAVEAEWLANLGVRYQDIGEYPAARTLFEQALKVMAQLGDQKGVATVRYQLGIIAQRTGDIQAARDLYREHEHTGAALRQLGIAAQNTGDYGGALDYLRRSLKIEEESNNKIGISHSFHQLGNLALLQGNVDEASNLLRKSLALSEELLDKPSVLITLISLASIDDARGYRDDAVNSYLRCLRLADELGDQHSTATVAHNLGHLYYIQGDVSNARRSYERSLDLENKLGNAAGMAKTLIELAKICSEQGNYPEGLRMCDEAARLAETVGDVRVLANARATAGELLVGEGRTADAVAMLVESYERLLGIEDSLGVQSVLVRLVQTRKAMGSDAFWKAARRFMMQASAAQPKAKTPLLDRLLHRGERQSESRLETRLAQDLASAEERETRHRRAVADPRGLMYLSELHHLHHFMTAAGIKNKGETNDRWVLKHLDEFRCYSVEDVKREYNRLATLLGKTDVMLR